LDDVGFRFMLAAEAAVVVVVVETIVVGIVKLVLL
jgi:hypothetical protein